MAQKKEASKKSGTVASINDSLKKATTEMLVLFVLHQKSMYTYEARGDCRSIRFIRPSIVCAITDILKNQKKSCHRTTGFGFISPLHRQEKRISRICGKSIRTSLIRLL